MTFNDIIDHLWQIIAMTLSGLLSLVFYKYKQSSARHEFMMSEIQRHTTLLIVLEERINHMTEDLDEMKLDIKQMLYKADTRSNSNTRRKN